MINGQFEPEDAETMHDIYKKINVHGVLKAPLTVHEQVLLFCIWKWIEDNVK